MNIWKIQVWIWFCFSNIADNFTLEIFVSASSPTRAVLICLKRDLRDFRFSFFLNNYFIFSLFILHTWKQTRFCLIAFLSNLLMESWQKAIINRRRDVENLFASASDQRIFEWKLSFGVYQKYFRKFDFYGEIFSIGPKENFTFLFLTSFSLLSIALYTNVSLETVFHLQYLNCIFCWNYKNNYLFVDAKISYT